MVQSQKFQIFSGLFVGLLVGVLAGALISFYIEKHQRHEYLAGFRLGALVRHYRDIIERYEAPNLVPLEEIKGCPLVTLSDLPERFNVGCATLEAFSKEELETMVVLLLRLRAVVVASQLQISEHCLSATCRDTGLFMEWSRPLSRLDRTEEDAMYRSFILDRALKEDMKFVVRAVR